MFLRCLMSLGHDIMSTGDSSMKSKTTLSLLVLASYLMQIPFVVYFIVAMINEELSDSFASTIIIVSCAFAFIALICCVANFVLAAKGYRKESSLSYKSTMLAKLCMIPFYLVNFTIWGIFIVVCLMSPFLIAMGVFMLILSIASTYVLMLASGSHNIFAALKDFFKTKNPFFLLCLIGHFIFCLDVVSSIALYAFDGRRAIR